MSLLRTSFTLRRLFLEPIRTYKPFTPATRHVIGPARCPRPPWAHQSRFTSNDSRGSSGEKDPYKVLGVPTNAAQEVIKKAYYGLAKKLHPDASKKDASKKDGVKFLELSAAYDKIKTPEARERHDAKVRVRERERARQEAEAQKERDLAAQKQREMLARQTKERRERERAKQEAEARKERDLAARKQREMLDRQAKERREREAALRDRDKPKAPDHTKATNGSTAPHHGNGFKSESKGEPKSKLRSESRSDPKNESSLGDKARQAACDDEKGGAASAQKATINPNSESLRVAMFRLGAKTSIEDVVKPLASYAVGQLIRIQITQGGTAKLDFFTAGAAHKFQRLARRGKFIVNGKKVGETTLHVSGFSIPSDPHASRVLLLTDRAALMPVLDLNYVQFILRQNDLNFPWVQVKPLSRTKTEIHFSSCREAKKAIQVLQLQFPDVQVSYGIDPATGKKEPRANYINWMLTGDGLPDTPFYQLLRILPLSALIWGSIVVLNNHYGFV